MFGILRLSAVLSLLAGCLTGCLTAEERPAIREALAELQRGDFAAAERTLQLELRQRPRDGAALTLLGVALDGQKKFAEAGPIHRRAAAASPDSPDVWNNYANHLAGTGDAEGARKLYLKVVALDPSHFNANVQLIRFALKQKDGATALEYLRHLPPAQQEAPNLAALAIAAYAQAGQKSEADRLVQRWRDATRNNQAASFAIGAALADSDAFAPAEIFLTQALALAPSDFGTLFSLGVVEWHNGNYQRASEVLEAARRQQPQNVDVLYNLACVEQAARHPEAAVALLAQAERLAPQRADVQRLLALAAGDVGALADSAAAWDRYLKLAPSDDVARRERGFILFQMGRLEEGVGEIRRFVARYPNDAVGHFELGAAENKDNPAQALVEFDRALALQPDFAAAHSARGSLYYQMGKPEAALADLEAAAALRPDDAVSLDRLGQTYLSLDRAADAVRVLRKAAALDPGDSKTQLHLARALADAGNAAESKAAMDRFRQMGSQVRHGVPGGLVDYLSLTPQQRRADYRARVERMVREHPADPAAQLTYLRLLLEDGEFEKASAVARTLLSLKSPPATLAEAGRALLEARQYVPARELLARASAIAPGGSAAPGGSTAPGGSPATGGLELDLALAEFHTGGPARGLQLLDHVPAAARHGDYFLARAEMLDASGRESESAAALQQALRASPAESSLYCRAGAFLLEKGKNAEALAVSEAGLQALPQDRRVLLLRAIALERAGRPSEADSTLQQIQNRWPEWSDAWLAHSLILKTRGRTEDAAAALKTATALGAGNEQNLESLLAR